MKSSAATVKEYLASLPEDRRAGIEAIRKVILKNLDKDYEESMLYGMIGYSVPHRVWPTGYHCDPKKPLMMAAVASQKNKLTVYLMPVYNDKAERDWFEKAWAKSGKKLDMGGSCIRFATIEHAALEVIGEAIRRTPARKYVEDYVRILARTGRGPDGKKLKTEQAASASKVPTTKAPTTKKSSTKQSSTKQSSTKQSSTKQSSTKKASAKKPTAKKPVSKKSPAKPARAARR